MLTDQTTDTLLSAIPFSRITLWSGAGLGLGPPEFSALVSRLLELEDQGVVDLLSVSRQTVAGQQQISAVKFVRTQPDY